MPEKEVRGHYICDPGRKGEDQAEDTVEKGDTIR
jgi:hypothetical protein